MSDQNPPARRNNKRCKTFQIATLNTRTLRTHESLLELEEAIEEINYDILGISEMRRAGEKIEEHKKYILYQKGEPGGQKGVGFLIKQSLKKHIRELIGISDRLAILNIDLPGYKKQWSIMQAYAPTEQSDAAVLESFYDEMSRAISNNADKHIILMGDFNAQVGARQNNEEHVLGKFGHGKRSRNGEKLVEFLMEHNLTVLNSTFKKNTRNKWTWISPDGSFKNEIDYVTSNHPKAFTDTTVISKLNFNTNHRMVRCSLRKEQIKTSRHLINNRSSDQRMLPTLMDGSRLGEVKKQVSNEGLDPIEKYELLEKRLQTSINRNQVNNKYQLSDYTLHLLKDRKDLISSKPRKETIKKITDLSKKIRENIRKDRKRIRLKTLEHHITRTGGVNKALKELRESGKEWIPRLKKKTTTTSKRNNIKDLATNFYRQLYSRQTPNATIEQKGTLLELTRVNSEEPIPEILQCEVEKSIKSQKAEKSPGPDKITNELLKGTMEELAPILTKLFNEIIIKRKIPEQWTKSHIILLHKKGNKDDIENYRPISLMSNVYKVFAKIILDRVTKTLDAQQPVEQAGFRKGFSTIDHIHTVKQILEKYTEYNKKIYIAFIDYAKAFDSISHVYLLDSLEQQGVPAAYIDIINMIYNNNKAKIQLESLGNEFKIERGVRQGDPLSPKLFSAALESVFRNLEWEDFGINVNGKKLNHLRFADDLVLFEEDPIKLGRMVSNLNEESIKIGLKMNTKKTKLMTNSTEVNIGVDNELLKYVSEYTYLGQVVSFRDQMAKEISMRTAIGWKRYWSLKEIMKSRELSMAIKRKAFDTCILPCLTYGCETWALTMAQRSKLARCQRAMERSMTGHKRKDRVRNSDLRIKTGVIDILTRIDQQKWRWTGHMLRDTLGKWSRQVTDWYPRDGRRNRGKQYLRWEDDIKITVGPNWRRVAKDREQWKLLEEAYAERHTVLRDIL